MLDPGAEGSSEDVMPKKDVTERARQDAREGKSPSTQAGEFVHEEIEHIREGKHGAQSTKQAIAIGLSKARRAGVKLPPPGEGSAPRETRRKAQRDLAKGKTGRSRQRSSKRARATTRALKRKGRSAASKSALSRQARAAARKRSAAERSEAARKAARTKGPRKRAVAARKAARARARAR
jgi:Family of unknown function (DUF6496)